MPKTLLITVGGSHQPILTAINQSKPDRIIFVCSKDSSDKLVIGKDKPCEVRRDGKVVERLPNIPTQLNLTNFDADKDMIVVSNPDDLTECYLSIKDTMTQLLLQSPQVAIQVDYTGGTKTMSVALALAALDHDTPLFLTTGARTNTIKVTEGEFTRRIRSSSVVAQRSLEKMIPALLEQYNFPAATAELQRIARTSELDSAAEKNIQALHDLCAGFDAWDAFDHQRAWALLSRHMNREDIRELGLFLRRVIASRAQLDATFNSEGGSNGHGYEIVQDLLRNAERRAHQKRYDDAVGRLYRALELLVQIRLQHHSIMTEDVDIDNVPETYRAQLQSRYEGQITIGIVESYDLLSHFSDDPLGSIYQKQRSQIQDVLQLRNKSLFAHGFTPLSQANFQRCHQTLGNFILEGITAIVSDKVNMPPQFPQKLS